MGNTLHASCGDFAFGFFGNLGFRFGLASRSGSAEVDGLSVTGGALTFFFAVSVFFVDRTSRFFR
jgi:hypothetical protein